MKQALLSIGLAAGLAATLMFSAGRVSAQTGGASAGGAFDQQAEQVVTELSTGDFTDVVAKFDSTLSSQLTADDLALAWSTYQAILGPYQSAGQPTAVMQQDLTVEQVPITLANGSGVVNIAFHSDGTIAGLNFARA